VRLPAWDEAALQAHRDNKTDPTQARVDRILACVEACVGMKHPVEEINLAKHDLRALQAKYTADMQMMNDRCARQTLHHIQATKRNLATNQEQRVENDALSRELDRVKRTQVAEKLMKIRLQLQKLHPIIDAPEIRIRSLAR
jgi:hypothetical protein